jgi:hypothetical protein
MIVPSPPSPFPDASDLNAAARAQGEWSRNPRPPSKLPVYRIIVHQVPDPYLRQDG